MSIHFKRLLNKVFKNPQNVTHIGHPILRIPATKVAPHDIPSRKFQNIMEEMKLVFESRLHPVVGLAAPQIGHAYSIIGYQIKDKETLKENNLDEPVELTFLFNPEIMQLDKEANWKADYESCVSVPLYSGLVKRSNFVKLKALDEQGKPVELEYSGFLARILQHELDHLNGLTFVDRMEQKSLRHDRYVDVYEIRK